MSSMGLGSARHLTAYPRTVTTNFGSPFDRPKLTWRGAALRALAVEVILFGLLLPGFFHSGGADNPSWFFLALILQFPFSLVFLSPAAWDHLAVCVVLVALSELCLLIVLFRRPWGPLSFTVRRP